MESKLQSIVVSSLVAVKVMISRIHGIASMPTLNYVVLTVLVLPLNISALEHEFPYSTTGDKSAGEAGHCLEFTWDGHTIATEPQVNEDESVAAREKEYQFTIGHVMNTCDKRVALVACHPLVGACDPTVRKWSWSDKGIATVYPLKNLSISSYMSISPRRGQLIVKGSVYLACFTKNRERNPRMAVREVEDGLVCRDAK